MGAQVSGEMSVKIYENMVKTYEEILQSEFQELKKQLKNEFQNQLGLSKNDTIGDK